MSVRGVVARGAAVARACLRRLQAAGYVAGLTFVPGRRIHYAHHFLAVMEGDALDRGYAALVATAPGVRLAEARPDGIALLRDRAALRRLPAGSLGRAYEIFMSGHALDEALHYGAAMAAALAREPDPARRWFRVRSEAAHDLRHVLTGYGPDRLGEACLQLYRFAQIGHAGYRFLACYVLLVLSARRPVATWRAAREAYRLGRTARFLDLLPWEEMLAAPLDEVRRTLGITLPTAYPAPSARPAAASEILLAA